MYSMGLLLVKSITVHASDVRIRIQSESSFRGFWPGFGFGSRNLESGFGFKKKIVGSDSKPDSRFLVPITSLLDSDSKQLDSSS